MKLMTGVAALAMSLVLASPARAQEDKEALKKKILDEIAKKLDEEMKRILDEVSKLIDDEIAKARGRKPAAPPPAAGGKPGFLGVSVDSEQPDAEDFKAWKVDGGVRITLVEGGAAEKAGLQDGDVIIEADGQKIREFPELQEFIRSRKAGETVRLKYLRGKESKEVSVTLAGRTEPGPGPAAPPPGGGPGAEPPPGRIGIRPGNPSGKGMTIEGVSPNAPAEKAGIKGGDILTKLDDTPIWKESDLENFMKNAKAGQKVDVTVLRNGEEKKFTVVLIEK
jgi:serine protease Do